MSADITRSLAEHRLNKFYYERWQRDNRVEAPKVIAYLDGGARPSDAEVATHYGKGLLYAEDARRSLTPAPPPTGSEFFVSPSGSDSADGSSGRPWKTITKACSSVSGPAIIRVEAGTYLEGAFRVPNGVSLTGARDGKTVVQCAALDKLALVLDTTAPQTISDLTLDGRKVARHGLWGINTKGLTLSRIEAMGFAPTEGFVGGAMHVHIAEDLLVSDCVLSNSAGLGAGGCNGILGLGRLTRAKVLRNAVTAQQGYAVKFTDSFGVCRDVEIADNRFEVLTASCSSWATIAVECWWTAENVRFHHNWLNSVLSLPEGGAQNAPGGPYRWRIDHNHFAIPTTNQYAIECGIDFSEIDHNFFEGGLYPLGQFHRDDVQDSLNVHHNVFDRTVGPVAVWLDVWKVASAKFHSNTVVLRQPSWRDGVFNFGQQMGQTGSTIDVRDNIFHALTAQGDKMGLGLGGATFDRNLFRNITPKGQNALTSDPRLPLAGGFPNAYLPAELSAQPFGAFADGVFAVGPQ